MFYHVLNVRIFITSTIFIFNNPTFVKNKTMDLKFDIIEILKVTMVLFAVIDVIGSIPIIISLKQKTGGINAPKASFVSLGIMIVFLFVGQTILDIIGISIGDFAIAGSILILIVAFEMILGVQISKDTMPATASVIPLAFPLIAGTGTLTTLLSIRAEYNIVSIITAIILNVIIVYIVLRNLGIILLALAIKLFRKYTGL